MLYTPKSENRGLIFICVLILISRIPFLFAGYGSEEDAWGLILTARNISLSGIYEVSRMPGHPVQEYLISLLWQQPAWVLNLLTAFVSTIGIFFFMKSLRLLGVPNAVPAGIAFAFVPVYYIHSTDIMDYTWALSLIMFAFYLMVSGNYILAGMVIGIATGFRITAGAMAIPFAIWHFMNYRSAKTILLSWMATGITAMLCYIPVWNVYGKSFFMYYEYFPYPPFLKNIYKGTVGAWGLFGTIALFIGVIASVVYWLKLEPLLKKKWMSILLMCLASILLYTYVFIRIPQKTAFVIPVIPFVLILFSILLSRKQLVVIAMLFIVSSFTAGINLADPIRGSGKSKTAIEFSVGATPVVFDPLVGFVPADYRKRKLKMEYARSVAENLEKVKQKTVIIAGWWQNELNYFSLKNRNPFVTYLYYADEKHLNEFHNSGYRIFYLPEQNHYNDLRFRGNFTTSLAEEFSSQSIF